METPTLNQLSTILTKPSALRITRRNVHLRKFLAALILMFMDMAVLFAAMYVSLHIRNIFVSGPLYMPEYISLFFFILPLFPLAYYFRGLYPGFGLNIVEELKTITYSTTIVFAILATMTFFVQGAWEYSRLAFVVSWILAIPFVPLGRSLVRKIFGNTSWWGIPVIVIGAGKAGEHVIKSLSQHTHMGLRPVVAIDDDIERWGYIDNIPVIGGLDVIPELSKKMKIDHAIIAMPGVARKRQQEIITKYSRYFTHTTIIPNLFGVSGLWVSTHDLGGILGLEVQQSLLRKTAQFQKRVFDIVLASLLMIVLSPLYLFVSLMIYLESKGTFLFRQHRMGINDSRFEMVKFRTMHHDAESKLMDILKNDDDLRAEFSIYHKLSDDPRLTKVGRFIRKYSLDELPQFWNVITGEMSLIGPRAYLPWEKHEMNGYDEIILKVKPGISGLWQVTDRNNSTFEERNLIDVYYIRNWSMFLDLYIVARTIGVILTGRGS